MVCGKIVISMCFDIFFMPYFSHFLLLYLDVLLCFFVDFSITQLYSNLPFFKIYSKNHYILCCRKTFISMCFYPEWLSIHFFHRKGSMKVSCYILYFPHKILISLPFFMTLYYICPTHSTLTLGENGKYPVD